MNNCYRIIIFNTKYNFISYELVEATSETEARQKYEKYSKKDNTTIIGINKCWIDPETGVIVG